jgi:hypothetical protein
LELRSQEAVRSRIIERRGLGIVYNILIGKSVQKKIRGAERRLKYMKTVLGQMEYERADRIQLAED